LYRLPSTVCLYFAKRKILLSHIIRHHYVGREREDRRLRIRRRRESPAVVCEVSVLFESVYFLYSIQIWAKQRAALAFESEVNKMVKGKVLRMYDVRAVFENLETGNCIVATQLKEGASRDLQMLKRSELPDLGGPSQVVPLEAIFGIYDLLSGSYVALVVESEPFVTTTGMNIRKVKKILVLPLFRNGRLLSETKQRDEDRYLLLLHKGFSEHQFFFSSTNDITLTQQRVAKLSVSSNGVPSAHQIWERADHRFFWNHDVIVDLIACEADEWVVPFMSAYVEYRPDCDVDGTKFALLFISRRSRYRQGCRFTKRGLDENGNAANFVETEQILLYADGKISSFVQIRGSIPLQWASPVLMKYDPNVLISANRARNLDLAQKHITDITSHYSDNLGSSSVLLINLVDNKRDQGRLGTEFKEVMDALRPRVNHPIVFHWFDFHHECKQKGKWNNLTKLVSMVDDRFRAQRYFCRLANGAVVSWQVGVIRTNCMDNLDRTNVVQSLFARRSLIMQLGHLSLLENSSYIMNSPFKTFEKIYKSVWANNADAISLGYAGTGALKVDFTKTGKRTLKGIFNDGVNSCMRYYINNLTDGTYVHTCICFYMCFCV
jgi:phosphatidylinositol 4-phosphatase